MKAIEQYVHVVLFITLHKVSWIKTLVRVRLNESYRAVLSYGASKHHGASKDLRAKILYSINCVQTSSADR